MTMIYRISEIRKSVLYSKHITSFQKQAKDATGGIATSWKNLKTRTVRAITEALNKINDGTKQYGGIAGIIEKITEGITKAISKVI